MKQLLIYFLIIGGGNLCFAQNRVLNLFTTKIKTEILFYEIQNMKCNQYGQYKLVEKQGYSGGPCFKLNTQDYFSIEQATLTRNFEKKTDLLNNFTIIIREKKNARNLKTTFQIFLRQKDWETRKIQLKTQLEEALNKAFPSYKLSIYYLNSFGSNRDGMVSISIGSATGGDEFETSADLKIRLKKMTTDVKPHLKELINQLHDKQMRRLYEEQVKPHQKRIKASQNPRKLHTLSFDILSLGEYDANRKRFSNVMCSDNRYIKGLIAPVEQARLLRADPTKYQIKYYIFERNMSKPDWSPDDPQAFGFVEIVKKESQQFVFRSRVGFSKPSKKVYYKYELYFPRFK